MPEITRRETIAALGAVAAASTLRGAPAPERIVKSGRLKQSVSRWCYEKIPMPEFCKAVAGMGLTVHFSTAGADRSWLVELRRTKGKATTPYALGSAGEMVVKENFHISADQSLG